MTALLFDLDGTIADTAPDLCAATNYVLGRYGHAAIAEGDMRAMIGGGALVILRRGFAARGVELGEDELLRATEIFIEYYDAHLIEAGTRVYPHLLEVLEGARSAGVRLGVVTNKREGLSAKLLRELAVSDFFEVLIGGDTLPTRKPDAAPVLEALRRLECAAGNAVMVGDSEADVASAHAAGVPCICVTFGYSGVPVSELGADVLIDSYQDFATALARLKMNIAL